MNWLQRDERERQIDLRAGEISYVILSFGVLVVAMLRSLRGEAPFDLLALVVVAGLAGQLYVMRRRAYSRVWIVAISVALAAPFLIAVIVVHLLGPGLPR